MNDRTVVYRSYYNPIEANIIRARLEDSGFACFLADENTATIQPLYNQAIGGVKLVVYQKDVEAINQLLDEESDKSLALETENFPDTTNEAYVCEKCGSTNVSYGMATKKKFSWWAIVIPLIVGVLYPFKGNKCYHCYDCGYEFR